MSMFQTLKPRPKHRDSATCLLLDTSGSMDCSIQAEEGPDVRPIELLFKAVRETPECAGLRAFTFNSRCQPLEVIPSESDALNFPANGGTALDEAFHFVKAAGFYSAILVTDGAPDSESAALTAAYGMHLGIIYIGNPPVPSFLQRLADVTGGTFALADLRDLKQLESAIVAALPPPDEPKGTINL